jgi:isopentenyl-diphosphate delta-isomerase
VVLLDSSGSPVGVADKAEVHTAQTPYHLAFSCYVFDQYGRLLVTRRAATKSTWPHVWTNSCCGHPQPAETVEQAVRRRLQEELGLRPSELHLALPDFNYQASMDGIQENELCPVFLARVDAEPVPDPTEVAEYVWSSFETFALRTDISPWAQMQVRLLGPHVRAFVDRDRG